jgi:hypothetical protein
MPLGARSLFDLLSCSSASPVPVSVRRNIQLSGAALEAVAVFAWSGSADGKYFRALRLAHRNLPPDACHGSGG